MTAPITLDEIVEIENLRAMKARYGQVVDGLVEHPDIYDVAMIDELFTTDAVIDFSALGAGVHEGIPAIRRFYGEILPGTRSAMLHTFHSPSIRVEGGTARASWTVQATATENDDPDQRPVIVNGRYDDEYVRTAAGWRQSRLVLRDARKVRLAIVA